jgi:two-component SAPR family response regulator
VTELKSWVKQNSTLVYFLIAQLIAIGAGAASILSYSVKLETRVHILETRGAAYSVQRMDQMANQIAVLQQKIEHNEESIRTYRDQYFKDMKDRQK